MKKSLIIISLITLSYALHAQEKQDDLKSLINQSFTYFPQFKELEQAVDVEQKRIVLAQSGRLPSIQATGSYKYTDPVSHINIPAGDRLMNVQIMPNNNFNTSLDVSYTLWDFGVVKANVERARAGLQYAKDNLDYNRSELAFQVGSIYYQIAYILGSIAIQDSVIDFLDINKRDTEIKFKNGDALKYDILSIQSSIDQEANRKIELQNMLTKQYALLEYATGRKSTDNRSDFTFPIQNKFDVDEALLESKANHPEFKLIRDRIKQAEAELKIDKTSGKPSLTLNGGTGYKNGLAPNIDKFTYNYSAGVMLSIPIYEGGRAKKQVALSRSQLLQSQFAEESLSNAYRKDIQQALTDITSNSASLANAANQITAALEAQKLAQSRFRNGIGTYLELTNASTNVQKAELTDLQYKYQLCIAQLMVAKLTGLKYW